MPTTMAPRISIIVPCYDEEESLPRLCEELARVIAEHGLDAEVLLVDDGSQDGSRALYPELCRQYPWLRALLLKRNFGQTAAMRAGIEAARGEILIPMDADLQNDPADIPGLLAKMDEGYEVVSGWRKERHDALVTRRLPSMVANKLISWISGVKLHDLGCSLKAYRRETLEDVVLYGEMHRFIPVYAHWAGGRVGEIVVNHRARRFGTSKYGLNRTFKVVLDLITVKFLCGYAEKPIHFFGLPGILMALVGFLLAAYLSVRKLAFGLELSRSPMLLLAILMILLGFMLVMLGVLAEVIIRTYHESQGKSTYRIASEISGAPADAVGSTASNTDATRPGKGPPPVPPPPPAPPPATD
jgi:glycosyltransferase involved in cell wall biosynthesis